MDSKFIGYYSSPIGLVEIVCSEDALLSVRFVEEKEKETSINNMLKKTQAQLKEYFEGSRIKFDLKLSPEGTEFQKKIWKELLDIPYGNTISYSQLALRIGNEKGARAVGNANGKNKIWVIIPCHRVIGADGSLTGYAGGIERKRWLLEHEKIV